MYKNIATRNSNIKFQQNPSNGSKSSHADRRTDITTLTVALRKFAEAPKNRVAQVKQLTT
jgi:hypothetical protein